MNWEVLKKLQVLITCMQLRGWRFLIISIFVSKRNFSYILYVLCGKFWMRVIAYKKCIRLCLSTVGEIRR